MKLKTYSVEFPGIEEIKPYFRNSKMHTGQQIKELAQSITRFGFDQPIVVDDGMVIIKGHGRYFAALKLKLKNVPVIVRDDLSDVQIKQARVADNKIFEMTTIDMESHAEELDSIAKSLDVEADTQDFVSDYVEASSPKIGSSFQEDFGDFEPEEEADYENKDAVYSNLLEEDEEPEDDSIAPELDNGTLMVCPKCVTSFYVQKG